MVFAIVKQKMKVGNKMKKTKIVSIVIAMLFVLSSFSVLGTNAKEIDSKTTFANIDEVNVTVNNIFSDNYDEFVTLAKKSHLNIDDVPDDRITFVSNCGPSTNALQIMLYDRGVLTERQKATNNTDHIYNLLRTSFSQTPNEVTCTVIDSTYKQYLTSYYTEEKGLTIDDLASDVPGVLVYEYGDYEMLKSRLAGMKNHLDDTTFESACQNVFQWEYTYEYLIQDLQTIATQKFDYSSEFLDALRTQSGAYNAEPTRMFLNNGTVKTELSYSGNGIYRYLLKKADVQNFANGFTITDENDITVYGADDEQNTVRTMNAYSTYIYNNCGLMVTQTGTNPILINECESYLPYDYIVSLDVRAKNNKACLYIAPVTKTSMYGDVNGDSIVDINDVTMLQKSIAHVSDVTLDQFQEDVADVCKCGADSISNVTEISKYIAGYNTEKCGKTIYFSTCLNIEVGRSLGYVE